MPNNIIQVPVSRIPRLFDLLGIDLAKDSIVDVLLTPTGGLVTRLKKDHQGEHITKNGELVRETLEIMFTDETDPKFSSARFRRDHDE